MGSFSFKMYGCVQLLILYSILASVYKAAQIPKKYVSIATGRDIYMTTCLHDFGTQEKMFLS